VNLAALLDVGNIHPVNIARTASIPGAIGLAGPEREPDGDASATDLDAPGKSHKGGRPDWPFSTRSRNPAPSAAIAHPTSKVKWSITPRLILDPYPSPWVVVDPMPVVIRRPPLRNVGKPHIAVIGAGGPLPIGVQIFGAGGFIAYVAKGSGAADLLVAPFTPLIEIILIGWLKPLWVYGIGADKLERLARRSVHPQIVGPGDIYVAVVIGENGALLVGIHVDAKIRCSVHRGAAARGLHVKRLPFPQSARTDVKSALGSAKSDGFGGEIDESDVGVGTNAHVCPAHLHLRPSVGVGIDSVARTDRVI
jgi:hypothetical protein